MKWISCFLLLMFFDYGISDTKGPSAVQLDDLGSKESCDRGMAQGCYNLGVKHYNEKNKLKAHPFFAKSCRLGLPQGCLQTARVTDIPAKKYAWLTIAEEEGAPEAKAEKAKLKLTDTERMAAEDFVRRLRTSLRTRK